MESSGPDIFIDKAVDRFIIKIAKLRSPHVSRPKTGMGFLRHGLVFTELQKKSQKSKKSYWSLYLNDKRIRQQTYDVAEESII